MPNHMLCSLQDKSRYNIEVKSKKNWNAWSLWELYQKWTNQHHGVLAWLQYPKWREVHPVPKIDDLLAQLSGATIFSKLDANSGFWQIPLEKESRPLTTFITPMGRYCFNKLPFGITSAPEHFQKQMSKVLVWLEGALCLIDDILVYAKTQEAHDIRLEAVLKRIQKSGLTLNPEKCEFSKSSLTFLGHVVDKHGVHPDPQKNWCN